MRVFVLDKNNNPLMPCNPCKARKLLSKNLAEKVWSKFGTFGIKLKFDLKSEPNKNQVISLGYDPGTKFEGFSVASQFENQLNLKLDLPEKKKIKDKLEERSTLRRSRRQRKTRYRKARFQNRSRNGFVAPSQLSIVQTRISILKELFRIFPISVCGVEDVRFNHAKKSFGKNFSTVEIGKAKLYEFLESKSKLFKFQGFETKELREKYGYKKVSNKSANVFESHCCDSLALANEVNSGLSLKPNPILIVVDKTYKFVRRKLHDTQPAKGGLRASYAKGTVFGIKKGKILGYKNQEFLLTGFYKNKFRISDKISKKQKNQIQKFDFLSKNLNAFSVAKFTSNYAKP